jgi:hypothetical protein
MGIEMHKTFKFSLIIFMLSLLLPVVALADEEQSYLDWLRAQQAKGNPPASGQTAQPAQATATAGGSPTTLQPAAAGAPVRVDYTGETDVTGLMQRLTMLLTSPDWFGGDPALQPAIKELQDSGKLNLTGCQETLHIDADVVRYTMATHYAGLAPDSYKGKLYALPNQPLQSAQYVSDDALIYLGLNNVPQSALIIFHWLVAHPETLQEGPLADAINKALSEQLGGQKITADELAQAEGLLQATGLEAQLNSLLTGEVAAAVYDADVEKLAGSNSSPQDVDAVVFLGVRDSAAVANLLTGMGADAGITANGEVNGWKLFSIADAQGIGIGLNGNTLVAATHFDKFTQRLTSGGNKLATPDCQYYIRFNLQRLLQEYAEPLATKALTEEVDMDGVKRNLDAKGLPSAEKLEAAWRYLLDFDHIGDLGALTLSGRYDSGYACEATLKPAVFLYGVYQLGRAGGVAALQDKLLGAHIGDEGQSSDIPNGNEPSGTGAYPDTMSPENAPAIIPGGDEEMHAK